MLKQTLQTEDKKPYIDLHEIFLTRMLRYHRSANTQHFINQTKDLVDTCCSKPSKNHSTSDSRSREICEAPFLNDVACRVHDALESKNNKIMKYPNVLVRNPIQQETSYA